MHILSSQKINFDINSKLPYERGLSKIQEIFCQQKLYNSFIAGGSLFRLLECAKDKCDIDIFCTSYKDLIKLKHTFSDKNNFTKGLSTDQSYTYYDKDGQIYQLIKHVYHDPISLVDDFDLNISQILFNKDQIIHFHKDNVKIKTHNIKCPLRTLTRIVKFSKYRKVSYCAYANILAKIADPANYEQIIRTLGNLKNYERFY